MENLKWQDGSFVQLDEPLCEDLCRAVLKLDIVHENIGSILLDLALTKGTGGVSATVAQKSSLQIDLEDQSSIGKDFQTGDWEVNVVNFSKGDTRAWLVAVAAAGVLFCTLSYANDHGVYQAYYER